MKSGNSFNILSFQIEFRNVILSRGTWTLKIFSRCNPQFLFAESFDWGSNEPPDEHSPASAASQWTPSWFRVVYGICSTDLYLLDLCLFNLLDLCLLNVTLMASMLDLCYLWYSCYVPRYLCYYAIFVMDVPYICYIKCLECIYALFLMYVVIT